MRLTERWKKWIQDHIPGGLSREILEKWLLQKVFGHQDTFEQDKSLDEISKLIRTLLKKNLPINWYERHCIDHPWS